MGQSGPSSPLQFASSKTPKSANRTSRTGRVFRHIPHATYRPSQLQRLVVFYCSDHQTSKVVVHQLITDSGFVGLDAGRLWIAKALEPPGRLHRAGLIGIAQARRLLNQLVDPVQNELLASCPSDQPAFAEEASTPSDYKRSPIHQLALK